MDKAPVLLFGYGNISRGDDALAPMLLEQIQQQRLTSACGHPVRFLSDYQMQVEHVMDMQGCQRILLIDADLSIDQPYQFYPVKEQLETSYTTHGMSPATLLHTFRQVHHQGAPLTSMLAIRGVSVELGQGLTLTARNNLNHAFEFLHSILKQKDFLSWDEKLI